MAHATGRDAAAVHAIITAYREVQHGPAEDDGVNRGGPCEDLVAGHASNDADDHFENFENLFYYFKDLTLDQAETYFKEENRYLLRPSSKPEGMAKTKSRITINARS